MIRTTYTSICSAVLLSLLAAAVGSPTQPTRNIQDPLKGMQPLGANKAGLHSHEPYSEVATTKYDGVDNDNERSWQTYAPQVEPQPDAKFLSNISLPRDTYGYLEKQIPCQDETSGCRVILSAEEADNYSLQKRPSKFFLCLATVVCRDECTLKCTAPVEDSVPGKPPVPAEKLNEQLVKFEKNVTSQVGALDVKLTKLTEEFDSQKNKLVEIGHQLNRFNDALQEKLRAATASTLESVDSKAREVKALLNEKAESVTTTISSGLSMVVINPKTRLWTLTGYAGLKAEAMKDGWAKALAEEVYIQRYLIYWGIYFRAEDGLVSLHVSFGLKKGRYDEFLDWPFSNKVKLCIIHPETHHEHCASEKPYLSEKTNKYYARPLKESNNRVYFGDAKVESSYIEKNGYIKEDNLLLKLEVLS